MQALAKIRVLLITDHRPSDATTARLWVKSNRCSRTWHDTNSDMENACTCEFYATSSMPRSSPVLELRIVGSSDGKRPAFGRWWDPASSQAAGDSWSRRADGWSHDW